MDIEFHYDLDRLQRAYADENDWDDMVTQGLIEGRRPKRWPRPTLHRTAPQRVRQDFISPYTEFEYSLQGY